MSNATNTSYAGSPAPTPSVAPPPESTRDVISFIGGLVAAIIVALLFLSWVFYMCRKKYLRDRDVEAKRRTARSSAAVPTRNPAAELTARVPKKPAAASQVATAETGAKTQPNRRNSRRSTTSAAKASAPAPAPTLPGPPPQSRRKSRLPGPPPVLPGPPPVLPGPPPRAVPRLSRLPGPPPLPSAAAQERAGGGETRDDDNDAGDVSTWGDSGDGSHGGDAIGIAEDPAEEAAWGESSAAASAASAAEATGEESSSAEGTAAADGKWQWNDDTGWQWVSDAPTAGDDGALEGSWQWNDETGWQWVTGPPGSNSAAAGASSGANQGYETGYTEGEGEGYVTADPSGGSSQQRHFTIGQGTRVVEQVQKQTVTLRRVSVIRGDNAMTQRRKEGRVSRSSVADGFAAASVARPSIAPHSALSTYAFTATVARAKLRVPSSRESSATSLAYRPSGFAAGSASARSSASAGAAGDGYDDDDNGDEGGDEFRE